MGVRFFHHGEESEAGTETYSQEDPEKIREIEHIMENLLSVLKDQNATADALRARFKSIPGYGAGSCDPVLF